MSQAQVQVIEIEQAQVFTFLHAFIQGSTRTGRPEKDSVWGAGKIGEQLVAFWGRRTPGASFRFKTYENEAAMNADIADKKAGKCHGIEYTDVMHQIANKDFAGDLAAVLPTQYAVKLAADLVDGYKKAGVLTRAKNAAAKAAPKQETAQEAAPEVVEASQEVTETPVVAEAQVEQDVPVEPVIEVVEQQVTQESPAEQEEQPL